MAINDILRKVGKISLTAAIGPSLMIGSIAAWNAYYHHNVQYEEHSGKNRKMVVEKMDGPLALTAIEVENDKITVRRDSFFGGFRSYELRRKDHKLVRMHVNDPIMKRGGHFRDIDLENNPQLVSAAEKEIEEQLHRFRPYLRS